MPKQSPDGNSRGASPGRIWVISFLVWLGLTYTPGVNVKNYAVEAVVGLLLTGAISFLSVGYIRVERPAKSLTLRGFLHLLAYFITLTSAIIKANLNMARIVLSPSLPIRPGIVRIKTSLKSSTGKLLLSNSITLTPGTLTLNVMEDEMYIHWVSVKEGTQEERGREIKGAFERHLKEVFG